MGRVIRSAIVLAIVAVGLVATAPPAAACSCATMTDDEALDAAEVAFVGDMVDDGSSSVATSSASPRRVVFAVDRVHKGDARARQSVVTPFSGSSCGLELSGPGPFVVFASTTPVLNLEGEDGELYSHLCSGSRAVTGAALPASFGEGHPPDAGSSPIGRPDDEGLPAAVIVATASLVALVVAGACIFVRTRRSKAVLAS